MYEYYHALFCLFIQKITTPINTINPAATERPIIKFVCYCLLFYSSHELTKSIFILSELYDAPTSPQQFIMQSD